MINIKRFIDKVSSMEGRQSRDVVMPIAEARALRDEIAKLIIDKYTENDSPVRPSEDVDLQVEVKGSKW